MEVKLEAPAELTFSVVLSTIETMSYGSRAGSSCRAYFLSSAVYD